MRIVRKIATGLLATVVLAVAGYLALALFVALVNVTSSGQEEPTYNDDNLYDDYLNEQGRPPRRRLACAARKPESTPPT
jgi:hypothetical protein